MTTQESRGYKFVSCPRCSGTGVIELVWIFNPACKFVDKPCPDCNHGTLKVPLTCGDELADGFGG